MRRSIPKPSAIHVTGILAAVAAALAFGSLGVAVGSLAQGELEQSILMFTVAVFAAWMATAIRQFQQRITGIDEVVRQARERVREAEVALTEMRQLAQKVRSASSVDDSEENRTIH